MGLSAYILNPYFLYTVTVICCAMMVAEIPMFSFKFKHFTWAGNEIRYVYIIAVLLMAVSLTFVAIPAAVLLYVLCSMGVNALEKNKTTTQ
jgi:CDP-diacylglycerol--serine O-phosphatidyltransferase